jgi:hypothetical protein
MASTNGISRPAPSVCRLLQRNRHETDLRRWPLSGRYEGKSGRRGHRVFVDTEVIRGGPLLEEEFSTRLIAWSPFVIIGNTIPPRDPDEDEEEEDEEEEERADEPPVVREPDED